VVSAAFGDYDRDGRVDLALTRLYSPGGVLMRNVDGLHFERVPLPGERGIGWMSAFVDADQDGDLDLFFAGMGTAYGTITQAVFGEDRERYQTGSRMFWQEPDGWRRDTEYFAEEMPLPTMGVNFGDLDHDGQLDWYLGTGNPEGWMVVPNLLYIGTSTGRLENVSALGGVATIQKGHGIVFADFDRDGAQDIYSSLGGFWPGDRWPNQLLRNDGESRNAWTKLELHGCRNNRYGLGARITVHTVSADGTRRSHFHHMDNQTAFGSAPYLADIGLGEAARIESVEVDWIGPAAGTRSYPAELRKTQVLVDTGAVADSRSAAEALCEADAPGSQPER